MATGPDPIEPNHDPLHRGVHGAGMIEEGISEALRSKAFPLQTEHLLESRGGGEQRPTPQPAAAEDAEVSRARRAVWSQVTEVTNKFHEFLSDRIERNADEDQPSHSEESAGDFELLPQGVRLSKHYVTLWQDLVRTRIKDALKPEQFLNSLDKVLRETLDDPKFKAHLEHARNKVSPACNASQRESFVEKIKHVIFKSANNPSMRMAVGEIHSALQGILQRVRTNTSHARAPVLCEGDETPVVDLHGVTASDLNFMVHLFTGSKSNSTTKDMLEHQLSTFLPRVHVQSHSKPTHKPTQCSSCKVQFGFFQRQHTCFVCAERFCTNCPLLKRKAPCLGATAAQDVCRACFGKLNQQEGNVWVEAGIKCVKTGTLESVKAAHGSLTLALCSGVDISQMFLDLVQELLNLGWADMALTMAVSLLHLPKDLEVSAKANLLAAKALRSMTDQPHLEWGEHWILALATKEALFEGASLQLQCPSVLASELESQGAEVTSKLHQLYKQKEQEHDDMVSDNLQYLEQAWQKRNWRQLLNTVLTKRKEGIEEDATIEALQQFLASKEQLFDKMLPEDRFPLLLLRGVVKLHYKHFTEGLADIQKAAWSGHQSKWLTKAAVDIVLCLLSKNSECRLPFQRLHKACQNLTADRILSSNGGSLSQFLPQAEELTPPLKLHWPELVVSGLNMRATRKYEQAVVKRVQQGEWSGKDAALAYIDLIPACNHPAEVVTCFLTAGLWFLRELQTEVSTSQQQTNSSTDGSSTASTEVCSLVEAVLVCMADAYVVACEALHPGMRLYVSRVALRASLIATQISGANATSNDSNWFILYFRTFVYTCRFNPFCDMPTVSVSEAVLLDIISGRLHSQFLLGLQHVSPKEIHPVRDSELKYQLYENDLRRVCPLDSPDSARARAMEALLNEKGWALLNERGWTWEDVANLMSSPLCPRSDEGWLIQQPRLGTSMEYAELVGFVLTPDPNESSIQLLVKLADESTPGLFSQADVAEILTLEGYAQGLSLGRPNDSDYAHFHPFQEIECTHELRGTRLLRTMFEADYLLKSLSVGAEVSSNPPFNQRPTTEGLTANLPPKLRHVVRPVSERGPTKGKIHEFCIQNEGNLIVDMDTSGSSHMATPKMAVRTHPLVPLEGGELRDMANGQDPDSPEAQFAADLTKHYDELSQHFPILARLRELVKLLALNLAIRTSENEDIKARSSKIEVPDSLLQQLQQKRRTEIESFVEELSSHITVSYGVWPKAEDELELGNLAIYYEIQAHLTLYHVDTARVGRSTALARLRERDEAVFTCTLNALMEYTQQRVPIGTMTPLARNWMSSKFSTQSKNKLVEVIYSALPPVTHEEVRQMLTEVSERCQRNFSHVVNQIRRRVPVQKSSGTPCMWVPTAHVQQQVSNNDFSRCYGGVLLFPMPQPGQVPPTQGNICTVTLSGNTSGTPGSSFTSRPPTSASSGSKRKGQTHQQRTNYKASNFASTSTAIGYSDKLELRWSHRLGHKHPKKHCGLPRAMEIALQSIDISCNTHKTHATATNPVNAGQRCQVSANRGASADGGGSRSEPNQARVLQMYLLHAMGEVSDKCLRAGIDPSTKMIDALNILKRKQNGELSS